MKPIEVFANGKERAEHLVRLNEALVNRRSRGIRADWANNFRKLMRWAKATQLQRVDGAGALLVLHGQSPAKEKDFSTEAMDELLRAALVGVVSAMDRYVHEVVRQRLVAAIKSPQDQWNGELRRLQVPIAVVKSAIDHGRIRRGKGGKIRPRPMNVLREGIQEQVMYKRTFQGPDEIERAFGTVGIEKLWTKCADKMTLKPEYVRARLNGIANRRNKIVHEGDIVRSKRGGKLRLVVVSRAEVENDIAWITNFVNALDASL